MAFRFNGTSVTFTPAIGEIRSATFDESAAEIDVSNSADAFKIFEAGAADLTGTVEINGNTTAVIGDDVAFAIVWNDGVTSSTTTAVVTGKSKTGSVDAGITTTLTFKRSS